MKPDGILSPEGRDLREGMICSHIAKKAWVCKTLTSLHFPVIWTDKKKVKLEGCGCCLCSFFGSRELGWELSWLCPKERMKCILSPLGKMVLPFAFSGAMWWHQFSSPFLSPSNLHPLFSPHMIMWISSLPEFYSWTSLIWISSSQQREAFPCDFVCLQLWAKHLWGLKDYEQFL